MGDPRPEASGFLCVSTRAFHPVLDSKASRIRIVSDAAVSPESITEPSRKQTREGRKRVMLVQMTVCAAGPCHSPVHFKLMSF